MENIHLVKVEQDKKPPGWRSQGNPPNGGKMLDFNIVKAEEKRHD